MPTYSCVEFKAQYGQSEDRCWVLFPLSTFLPSNPGILLLCSYFLLSFLSLVFLLNFETAGNSTGEKQLWRTGGGHSCMLMFHFKLSLFCFFQKVSDDSVLTCRSATVSSILLRILRETFKNLSALCTGLCKGRTLEWLSTGNEATHYRFAFHRL